MDFSSLCFFIALIVVERGEVVFGSGQGFKYEGELGPEHWSKNYPTCGGTRQSPIDLVVSDILNTHRPLRRKNHDQLSNITLENNGHTVKLTFSGTQEPYLLYGGPLSDTYTFEQMHFHWGKTSEEGSEHIFNGYKKPLESHIVHYKTEYGSFNEAANHEDGIVVVALFYDVTPYDNPRLNELIAALSRVRKPETKTVLQPRSLRWFEEDFHHGYLYYNGSLTTPPCSEIVTWIIYPSHIPISEGQLAEFRKLEDEEGGLITHTFRDPQPLNGRKVYYDP